MEIVVKTILTFLFFMGGILRADTLTIKPLSLNGKPYEKVSKYEFPIMIGRQYLDLSSLSGNDRDLKLIQKDYERYVLLGKTSINLSILYVALTAFGVFKPGLHESFSAWIPWVGLMGTGIVFGELSKNKLHQFVDTYNNKSSPLPQSSYLLNYSWIF